MSQIETVGKYRHEYKYICNAAASAVLKVRASGILKKDIHAGEDGAYRIRSLYFDDPWDSCYYENESGVGERAKYRIRIYNNDNSRITLERKSKTRGMTQKSAVRIEEAYCRGMMAGYYGEITKEMSDTLKQILSEMQRKHMRPKVIVEYVRYPFIAPNGNVRVTFDQAISSSNSIADFLCPEIAVRPIMERGQDILEVKWDEFLPDYIKEIMQLETLTRSSFSKYYLCRKYNTYGGIRI